MRLWSERTIAQKVGILAVFGGTALAAAIAVGGGAMIGDGYWNKKCVTTSRQEDKENLGKVMRFEVPPAEAKKSLFARSEDRSSAQDSEEIKFVGGVRVTEPFEVKERIRVIEYASNCMYPPFSVNENGQSLGHPPVPMPAYCHISRPTASPAPTPTSTPTPEPTPTPKCYAPNCAPPTPSPTPNCVIPYCALPKPSPTPSGLSKDKLEKDLKRTGAPKYPSYLQSVGALKVGLPDKKMGSTDEKNPSPKEFWATGFMIADHVFATTCHAMEPLFHKDELGNLTKTSDGRFEVRNEDVELFVDFGIGRTSPQPTSESGLSLIRANTRIAPTKKALMWHCYPWTRLWMCLPRSRFFTTKTSTRQ